MTTDNEVTYEEWKAKFDAEEKVRLDNSDELMCPQCGTTNFEEYAWRDTTQNVQFMRDNRNGEIDENYDSFDWHDGVNVVGWRCAEWLNCTSYDIEEHPETPAEGHQAAFLAMLVPYDADVASELDGHTRAKAELEYQRQLEEYRAHQAAKAIAEVEP